MTYFVDRRSLIQKTAIIAAIVLLLFGGLYLFSLNKPLVDNFKAYYAKSYVALGNASLVNIKNSVASAFKSIASGKNQNRAVYDRSKNGEAAAIPVVSYGTLSGADDATHLSITTVQRQLEALKNAGYSAVSEADFAAFLKGAKKLPARSFLLTFDGGRKDTYYPIDPILSALGFKAVMFVSTGNLAKNDPNGPYLAAEEIKKAAASGRWEIGSLGENGETAVPIDKAGTLANFYTNKLWVARDDRNETDAEYTNRVLADLKNSAATIESITGKPAAGFSLPYNDTGANSMNFPPSTDALSTLIEIAYPIYFSDIKPSEGFSWNYPEESVSHAKRIAPPPGSSNDWLLAALAPGEPKILPYTGDTSKNAGWINTWGTIDFSNGLILSSTEKEHGALAYLDGTENFQNYFFTANVDFLAGAEATLIGRQRENGDYAECNFSNDSVSIAEATGGNLLIIKQAPNPFALPASGASLSLEAAGNAISCYIGGSQVLSAEIDESLGSGGIGFKTSGSDKAPASIAVSSFAVYEDADAPNILGLLPGYSYADAPPQTKAQSPVPAAKPEPKPAAKPAAPVPRPEPVPAATTTAPEPAPEPPPVVVAPIALYADKTPTPWKNSFGGDSPDISAWKKVLGTLTLTDGFLESGADASSTVSAAIVPGSSGWSDYRFDAFLDWFKGTSVSLMARYQDDQNYTDCTFSIYGSYVNIDRIVNGEYKTVARSPKISTPFNSPWLNEQFSIEVTGDKVACLLYGETVLSYRDPTIPESGGIGIRTWDKDLGNTLIGLHAVSVTPLDR